VNVAEAVSLLGTPLTVPVTTTDFAPNVEPAPTLNLTVSAPVVLLTEQAGKPVLSIKNPVDGVLT